MVYFPLIVAIILAVLNWLSVHKNWRKLEHITKPGTMIAMIWWLRASIDPGSPVIWFTLGAVFCLAGDIFLLFPQNMFIFGLLAFLIGQIAYIIEFNDQLPYINLLGITVLIILGIYIAWLYPKLSNGIIKRGHNSLQLPVLIYSLVISLMVYSAVMTFTRPYWPTSAALFVSGGAILFFISDSILAWDRFVNPLRHGRLIDMVTYHLGQFGIILGAILHISQT